jgi:predicted acetyltransferase
MVLELRYPETDAEVDALERVLQTSFAIPNIRWTTFFDRIGRANLRVVLERGEVIAGLGFYRMAQWFGGRSVKLAGIAGVGVAPEVRGRGIAADMCTRVLRELRDEGFALAALYATTATLYRAVGFEQAGTKLGYSAKLASLPRGDHALPCKTIDPREFAPLRPLYDARARAWTGHLDRTPALWERIGAPYLEHGGVYAYAVGEPIEGYVVFTQKELENLHFRVSIRDMVWSTPAAARRLCALLADLRSLGDEIVWTGCAADPLVSLLPEQSQKVTAHERWMLRVLDVARALESRGWPTMTAEVHLRVKDEHLEHNNGAFVLRMENGAARVERGGRGDVALDVRALAAMYSGFATPYTMAAAGLLEGDASTLAALFAGPEPWCCDHF